MTPACIVGMIFGGFILILLIICGTILALIRTRRGGISRKSRKNEAEETKIMQEIFRGLSRMESRVEALETILMDQKEKEKDK